jgi:uncharacterized membrane protein YphA (DoxX/SURF4 family)
MNLAPVEARANAWVDVLAAGARWCAAGAFLYLGLGKALHPVEFLKLVRQYGVLESPWLLNLTAAVLPWLEVACGALLLAGVAVRGTALVLAALLGVFSLLVFGRALEIREATALAFCAIRFDCGCGSGEVLICRKLLENAALAGLCLWQVLHPRLRYCLRPEIVPRATGRAGTAPTRCANNGLAIDISHSEK